MAGRSFFFRLAISAAFYAAAAGSCSLARADAESESQFGFQPPHGWVRSVGKDRTVYYSPQDAVASCFIAVRPPRRSINDSELSKYFNSEFESQINHLQSSNPGLRLRRADQVQIDQTAAGFMLIRKMDELAGSSGTVVHELAFIVGPEQFQEFMLLADRSRCEPALGTVALEALGTKNSKSSGGNYAPERTPSTPQETSDTSQDQTRATNSIKRGMCIDHCTDMYQACMLSPPDSTDPYLSRTNRTCGGQQQTCLAACPPAY